MARTSDNNLLGNDEELRTNLDQLAERREMASIREARYKEHMAKYYDQKACHIQLRVGDLVLRNNESSRAQSHDKLDANWEGSYWIVETFPKGAYKLA